MQVACCERCFDELSDTPFESLPEEYKTTTADFDFCEVCATYQRTVGYIDVGELVLVSIEPCDCYEKFGRELHNNGGNYHYSVYRRIQ